MKLNVSTDQLEFIIDECKSSLSFGDYFDAYAVDCSLDTKTTGHLLGVVQLLHDSITLKEKN
jgi:hypothetical protein